MAVATFIDELLQDQRELTAVEQFAQWHETIVPASPGRYRRLLPAGPPGPGEQYAFEVDLDRCSGCKACVTACHSLNGLDDDESWRSVGLLVSPSDRGSGGNIPPIQQHITTACHHCVDPACLHGCPVLAYDKDPVTGIVRHLDDQCIGCSYCVMKCPYEVPRYSNRLGIVRKCDLCSNRLSAGEAPACAQACPSEAIRITVVSQTQILQGYRAHPGVRIDSRGTCTGGNPFLPDSPPPSLTLPTTRFVSRRALPEDVRSAERGAVRLDSGHGPLLVMLVLTQAAAGLLLASAVAGWSGFENHFSVLNRFAAILLGLGLMGSVFHLGRPGKAWRAFLGWRRSWLSREIIVFNAMALIAGAACLPGGFQQKVVLTTAAAAVGFLAVFSSAMVYVDTRRPAWRASRTMSNFFGTALLLGATLSAVSFTWMGGAEAETLADAARHSAIWAMLIRTVLFVWRSLEQHRALLNAGSSIHWNACVVEELLPAATRWLNLLFVMSTGTGLLAIASLGDQAHLWAILAAVSTLSSELIGRYVYFAAGGTKRMPGVLAL
jgi:Fe-S-cluster-containing dehydrogenase component/DMSO reductase anchor subunit